MSHFFTFLKDSLKSLQNHECEMYVSWAIVMYKNKVVVIYCLAATTYRYM
jgi:hypothetical protein